MPDGHATTAEPVDNPEIRAALRDAARPLKELGDFTARKELNALTKDWAFTGIDVYEDSIFKDADTYIAPATIYVGLKSGERKVTGDAFSGRVIFQFADGRVTISDITIDTGVAA
jgi:hypothetical protein